MQLKSMSLKAKLSTVASLAILIASAFVMGMSFYNSIGQKTSGLKQQLHELSANYNQYVKEWIDNRSKALRAIPSSVSKENLNSILRQARDSAGFANVFMTYTNGTQDNAGQVTLAPGNNDPRAWEWYQQASAKPGSLYLASPSVASASKKIVISFGLAREINNQQVVLGADMNMGKIIDLLKNANLPGQGEVFVADQQGRIFAYKDTSKLNKPVSSLVANMTLEKFNRLSRSNHVSLVDVDGKDYFLLVSPMSGTRLSTVILVSKDSILGTLYHGLWMQMIVIFIVLVVCIVVFNVYSFWLFKGLGSVSKALEKIAQGGGDLTQRIKIDSQDEVGKLAHNFNQFISLMQKIIKDLHQEIDGLREDAQSAKQRANKTVTWLNDQQRDVTSVATAIEEMSSATAEIASHAQNTLASVNEASEKAQEGDHLMTNNRQAIEGLAKSVEQTSAVIGELHEHAQSINDILTAIQTIAEQTNLLALNAAIEAARAGEHGRGFAVVADEVRNLSQRTHSSTEQIQSTISTLLSITDRAVEMMQKSYDESQTTVADAVEAGEALEQINQAVQVISDMNAQIATAAEEQSQVTHDITSNTSRIKDLTDQLVDEANVSHDASEQLDRRAHTLSSQISEFKVE